jgi:hypothetical protein
MIKLYSLITALLLFFNNGYLIAQTILINEMMSSNAGAVADDEGDFSDWIELFNKGTSAVQLEGWGLSDNHSNPFKWVFPKTTIEPGKFLLVWASGKDRKPTEGERVNGVMREVYPGISGTSVSNLTQHASYPDKPGSRNLVRTRFEAPVNSADNYGQRMHGLIRPPATGNYTFWISSDDNGQLWLSTDEKPANLRQIASVPGWTNSREWGKFPAQQSSAIYLEKDKYYYIMALMKEGTGGDNLAVGWQLPDGTMDRPVSGIYLFWTGSDLHTNFSINTGGEEVLLTSPQGVIVDEVAPQSIPADISWGRSPDGSPVWKFFSEPTPGRSNSTTGYSEVLAPPVFSHSGGFYDAMFQLSLSSTTDGVSIIYTVDGSHPVPSNLTGRSYQYLNQYRQNPGSVAGPMMSRSFKSNIYSSPILIRDRSGETNQISWISSTYNSNPTYFPGGPVEKAVVVKARAVKDGALSSEVVSHTYFVRSGGQNPYALPVISLSAQEDELFGFNRGIYVAGADFENWRSANPSQSADGGRPANYHREGDEWEYPAGFEYFESNGTRVLGQNVGYRIHGGWSRSNAQKSLRIYARNNYGQPYLNHSFFSDQPYESYKRIVLRNSGNDNYSTMFRDAFIQEMVKHMNFETQAYQPAVMFLNGEYWGIHNIRERYDKYYLARRFDVDPEQVDILENNMETDEGDRDHYTETMDFIRQNDMKSPEAYQYIQTRIDVSSYIDYMLSQIYMVNADWPGNNIKYWRAKTPGYIPAAGPGKDGRWRWMMYDTDFGFGLYSTSDYNRNMMTFSTLANGTSWPNPDWSTYLFRRMLENESFREAFVVRFCDQLNTALRPEVVREIINRMKAVIEPEIGRHIQRWRSPGSIMAWTNNVANMLLFANQRPYYARLHLRQFFGLMADYSLTVDVSGPEHGHVIVNTIPLEEKTAGVDVNPYPWQGTYFIGLPLRLEAVAAPGYEFVRWDSDSGSFDQRIIELRPGSHRSFVAVFRETGRVDAVVHYWNFNIPEKLLDVTYTLLTAGSQVVLPEGGATAVTYDTGQSFNAANARFLDPAATHLRLNNPLGAMLVFDLPATGFSKIKFSYETRRSGQGAGVQIVEYSVNGTDFSEIKRITVKDDVPEVIAINFENVPSVDDNPDFKIRIRFEQGGGGNAGNNRFDNVTLEGVPGKDVNVPPVVIAWPSDIHTVEGTSAYTIPLNEIFLDQDGDELTYTLDNRHPSVAGADISGGVLTLNVIQRGETIIRMTATDLNEKPVGVSFRVMVNPEAVKLAETDYSFTSWEASNPEMTFPPHMLFLQSGRDDPGLNEPLESVYFIPAEDYAPDDAGNIGFPYRNSSRTRLNGLGIDGISFINTGRGRDLGGALLAVNTIGVDEFKAQWLAGTLLQNSRKYGLTLQYRIGYEGEFKTIPGADYQANNDGHQSVVGPLVLPADLYGKEYVQLLWRYHYLEGVSGARAQIRLDNILLAAKPSRPVIIQPVAGARAEGEQIVRWNPVVGAGTYELQLSGNPSFVNPLTAVGGIVDTAHLLSSLEPGKEYYLRVRGINPLYTGEWSETVYFNTWVTYAGTEPAVGSDIKVFPNPFNSHATIGLNVDAAGEISISLYDLNGRVIGIISEGYLPKGEHTFRIRGEALKPGTYIIAVKTPYGIFRQKLIRF